MTTTVITVDFLEAFSDNYIWVIVNHAKKTVIVVDPGEADKVHDYLASTGMTLEAILITHHHYDHTNGVKSLKETYHVPVYGPKSDNIDDITHEVKEHDVIHLPLTDITFTILEIPGHTLDHIAYVNDKMLFCGDTLFSAGCGRLFEGTAQQMFQSLQKIAALPEETKVYCAHEYTVSNLAFAHHVEPRNKDILSFIERSKKLRALNLPTLPSTIDEERKINPFLRCDKKDIIEHVEQHFHVSLTEPWEVFAYLREWKNQFKE